MVVLELTDGNADHGRLFLVYSSAMIEAIAKENFRYSGWAMLSLVLQCPFCIRYWKEVYTTA